MYTESFSLPRHDMYCREIAIFHVQSVSGAPTEGDGELTELSSRSLATEQYSPWDCSYIRDFIFLAYGKCQLKSGTLFTLSNSS